MSEVRLFDVGAIEQEVFTRWDITGHQVNRHLLSKALTGTDDVVLDHLTFPNVSKVDSQVLHLFAGVGSVDDIGYKAYQGQSEATPSLGRRHGSRPCG